MPEMALTRERRRSPSHIQHMLLFGVARPLPPPQPFLRRLASSPAVVRSKSQRKLSAKEAFSARKCPKALHLIDDEGIELVRRVLTADQQPSEPATVIVECSPGPGFLTQRLLASVGVKRLHLLEHHDSDYLPMLHEMVQQHQHKLSLSVNSHFVVDFVRHLRVSISELVSSSCEQSDSEQVWREEALPVKVFLPLPPFTDRAAVSSLVHDLCRRDGLFPLRCQFFLLLSFEPVCQMTACKAINSAYFGFLSIMMQSLFDVQVLGKMPLQATVPQVVRSRVNRPDSYFVDAKSLFLVRVTPKASLASLIPMPFWSDYRFFVRQAMFRKTGHVIPFFERYFPSSGARLIKIGVPLYSRFLDMEPTDFVRIFNECSAWPEYNTSTFRIASASFADETETDGEDEDEQPAESVEDADDRVGR